MLVREGQSRKGVMLAQIEIFIDRPLERRAPTEYIPRGGRRGLPLRNRSYYRAPFTPGRDRTARLTNSTTHYP